MLNGDGSHIYTHVNEEKFKQYIYEKDPGLPIGTDELLDPAFCIEDAKFTVRDELLVWIERELDSAYFKIDCIKRRFPVKASHYKEEYVARGQPDIEQTQLIADLEVAYQDLCDVQCKAMFMAMSDLLDSARTYQLLKDFYVKFHRRPFSMDRSS